MDTNNTILKNIRPSLISIILLGICAVILGLATYIEKTEGTATAKEYIYYSPLLFGLFAVIALLFLIIVKTGGYFSRKKIATLTVHLSLLVILIGACLTHFTGYEGTMHLREGETGEQVILTNRGQYRQEKLPFAIQLTDFEVIRYPGSSSASEFKSIVRVITPAGTETYVISMNNVLDVDGYRFFQASYDPDERGTILIVNHDPWGKPVTYFGYFALFAGLLLSLFHRHSRVMTLIRRQALCLLLIFTGYTAANASPETPLDAAQRYSIPLEHAEMMGQLPMQSGSGRIIPVNTFSREIMRKLYRKEGINGLTSDQCLLGIITEPEIWAEVPLIYNDNKTIAEDYSLPDGHCAFIDFFNEDGEYKLEDALVKTYRKDKSERDAYDKSLIKLDERVNLFNQLAEGRMLNLFPLEDDPQQRWFAAGDDLSSFTGKDSLFVSKIMDWYIEEVFSSLSTGNWDTPHEIAGMISTYQQAKGKNVMPTPEKLKAEMTYNSIDLLGYCRTAYLLIALLTIIIVGINIAADKPVPTTLTRLLLTLTVLTIIVQGAAIGLRAYISGYAPLSNSYETIVCLSAILAIIGAVLYRRNLLAFGLGVGMAGVMLFVSRLSWMDPQITPLVPVLKSPWLMMHVAIIMASYGFLCLSALLGLTNVILLSARGIIRQVRDLTTINEISMWIGLILLTAGTFMGAIWANESWGRYWSWDPKETWALVTILVYACVTHLHLLKLRAHIWVVNIFSVLAIASVIMTYWGVNYFLSGMHSYGG